MAPMKQETNYLNNSNYGEKIVRQANVLASCYIVDPAAVFLKGLHYCTTGATGAEWRSQRAVDVTPTVRCAVAEGGQHCASGKNVNDSKMVHGQLTPPPVESPTRGNDGITTDGDNYPAGSVASWLEIWDYAGGASFRAFVTKEAIEEGTEKTLFVFFDASALGRDLKHALVALIELAEGPLECAYMWAGFSLVTLDFWTGGLDVTSSRWLLMGMEM
ncbi:hypothetical protein P8C59_003507 [Phyllachora maydis]|uniref:Ornithine decarboxylase antizyme n=1 Tax=Phyllachora maydis TaxID=1825666 RepID=A0AAD9I0M0_9PEZI|nr:hypothetical protein P8C59_003507 [Phyllachora maydis]